MVGNLYETDTPKCSAQILLQKCFKSSLESTWNGVLLY